MIRARHLRIAYLAAVHAALVLLLVKVDAGPRVVAKIEQARVLDAFSDRMKARRPLYAIAFLGDSITHTIGPVPFAVNIAVSGATTTDLLDTLRGQQLYRAGAIALLIGTNDVWRGKTAGLDSRLGRIAGALPPDVPLVWSGIPPANDFRIDPVDIKQANLTIQALCSVRPRCTYVDTWQLLADGAGQPIPRYFAPDGVHLAAQGYERWLGAVEAALPTRSTP